MHIAPRVDFTGAGEVGGQWPSRVIPARRTKVARQMAAIVRRDEPDGVWREPAWIVHAIGRDEAIHFGRTFRQNTIVYCSAARPELVVTDPTCDDIGKTFQGNWRLRQ